MYILSKSVIIMSLCTVVYCATGFMVSAQNPGVDKPHAESPVITEESLDSIQNAGRSTSVKVENGGGEAGDQLAAEEVSNDPEQKSSGSSSGAPGWLIVLTICCIFIILCVLVVAIFSILSMSRSRGDVENAVNKLQDSKSDTSDDAVPETNFVTTTVAVQSSGGEGHPISVAVSAAADSAEPGDSKTFVKADIPEPVSSEGDTDGQIVLAPIPSRKVKDMALRRELRFRRAGESALTAQTATILGEITKARKNDQLDEAWTWLEQLKTCGDGAVSYHISKGKLHEAVGEWSDSEAEYNKAISLDPDRPNGYLRKARLLQKIGRSAESQQIYSHIQKKMVA